jgi:hypothetical protein
MFISNDIAIQHARWNYHVAMTKGHSANCNTVWRHESCNCPGRIRLHGTVIAKMLDEQEENARKAYLQATGVSV